jgi:hypothetical protein
MIPPGLAYSHTAMHNSLGSKDRGPPLVMCVSTSTEILFAGVDSLSQLIPADRPGLAVARWKIKSRTDELNLEIFQEGPQAVEPGLLDAIVLSVVLLRSGQSLGDSPGEISLSNPVYPQVLRLCSRLPV